MSTNYHGNLSIAYKMKTGKTQVTVVGDSEWRHTNGRMFYGAFRKFQPQGGWKGIGMSPGSQPSDHPFSNLTQSATNTTLARPTETTTSAVAWSNSGVRYSPAVGLDIVCTGSVTNDASIFLNSVYQNTSSFAWSIANPFANRKMTSTVSFVKTNNAHQAVYINQLYINAADGSTASVTSSPITLQDNSPTTDGAIYTRIALANSTAMDSTYKQVRTYIKFGTYTEFTASRPDYCYCSGIRVHDANATTGMEMSYIGEGGYSGLNHYQPASSDEAQDAFTDATNGKYSRNALIEHMTANDTNVVLIQLGENWKALGNNSDTSEGSGSATDIGSYADHIENVIARYEDTAASAGLNTPCFVLVCPWETNNGTAGAAARKTLLAAALKSITTYRSNVLFLDLFQELYDYLGPVADWYTLYTADGIHSNAAGADIFAEYIWRLIDKASNAYIKNKLKKMGLNNYNYTETGGGLVVAQATNDSATTNFKTYSIGQLNPNSAFTEWQFSSGAGELYTFKTNDSGVIYKSVPLQTNTATRSRLSIALPTGTWKFRYRQDVTGVWTDFVTI